MLFSAENVLDVYLRVTALSVGLSAAAFLALRAFARFHPNGCAANRYLAWMSLGLACVFLPVFAFSDAYVHRHIAVLNGAAAVRAEDMHFRFAPASSIEIPNSAISHAAGPRTEPALGGTHISAGSIVALLAGIWFAGAALLLIRLMCRLRMALDLKRGPRILQGCSAARRADIVLSDAILSPVAIGYFRPAILLPKSLAAPEHALVREHALAHEEAHLKRFDDFSALLYQVCVALAWVNPIVWFIGSHLEAEREKACDDAVVLQTQAAREYGKSLLSLCGGSIFPKPAHVLALFESPGRLTDRIEALVTKRPRSVHPRRSAAVLCLSAILVQAVFALAVTPGFAFPASLRILNLPPLLTPRAGHVAVLLNDGSVLIAGGMLENGVFLKSAELYVPGARNFVRVDDMHVERTGASAVTLPNGQVLVAGGWTGEGLTRSTELYDPLTRSFKQGPLMLAKRGSATATLLRDGQVLIAGGWAPGDDHFNQCAELYDWRSNQFSEAGVMHRARGEHTATLLADGTVLLAGGSTQGNLTLRSAEIYDPVSRRFTSAGDMTEPRTKQSATLLPDGRVLIAGGGSDYTWKHVESSAELFDPHSRTFEAIGAMAQPRFKDSDATVTLADGSVLFAGGAESLERFDPRASKFSTLAGRSALARHFGTATVLRDGSVLIAGGYGNDALTSNSSQLVTLR